MTIILPIQHLETTVAKTKVIQFISRVERNFDLHQTTNRIQSM